MHAVGKARSPLLQPCEAVQSVQAAHAACGHALTSTSPRSSVSSCCSCGAAAARSARSSSAQATKCLEPDTHAAKHDCTAMPAMQQAGSAPEGRGNFRNACATHGDVCHRTCERSLEAPLEAEHPQRRSQCGQGPQYFRHETAEAKLANVALHVIGPLFT